MGFLIAATILFMVDFIVKGMVDERLEEGKRRLICKDRLFLTKFRNRGAFRGMLKKHPEFLKGLSYGIIAMCTVVYLITLGKKGKTAIKVGLTMLLGGAYSNAYDRLKKEYVVDYFGFVSKNQKINSMIFNLSDFMIAIGALTAALSATAGE